MEHIVICIVAALIVIFLITRSFTHAEDPSEIGEWGERKVSNYLQHLPEGYYVIDDLTIPSQKYTTQIDHVVISVYGIFVIETKNYSGWIFGSNNSKKWKQTFRTESHYFYNPVKQNWAHIYALSELLEIDRWLFRPVVAFSDDAELNVKSSTPVIYMSQLENHILSYTKEILSSRETEEIYNCLCRINLTGADMENQHIQNVRDKIETQNELISQGKCPRCGGNLILRTGRYGQFYGCSNYPQCRFTNDI